MAENAHQKVPKKIFRGAIASVFSLAVTTIIGLLILPLVVNHLGDRLYGVWILVGTVTGYFAFLDLGLSKAVMRFVSHSLGKGDKDEADGWISIALVCFALLSVASVLLSIAVWFVTPRFLTDPEEIKTIPFVLLIALLAFSVTLPTRCFLGVLEAYVRRDIVSTINVAINLLRSGTIFIVVLFRGSLVELVLVTASYTIIDGLLIILTARYVHGPFRFMPASLCIKNIKIFSGYAFASFVSQIMDLIRYKSYPMIITPFLGLAALTPFAIAERLTQMLVAVCNGILLNLTPAFSQLEGQGGLEGSEKLGRYYFFSYKLSCYLGVFFVGMTLMLGEPFIERWMGVKYIESASILYVLSIGVFFSLIQIPTLCLLFAVSRHKFYATTNTLHAILTVFLCLILVVPFKLLGAAYGISIVTFIIKFFIQPYGVLPLVNLKFSDYHIKKSLPNIAIPLLYFIIFYFFARDFLKPNYKDIFLVGLTSSLSFFLYIFFVGFNKLEKYSLLNVIKSK